ncbi:MAG: DUF1501 domain-containing protein [Planctomycetota bacterium]|nr:MAG: DUF1501 domain-containing protein [Planctomycetota bacterium]
MRRRTCESKSLLQPRGDLMSECTDCHLTRRNFLKRAGITLGAFTFADPMLRLMQQSYAQTSRGAGNLLVLCQLAGGFDGLSFLAPYQNAVYRSKRPQLALGADDVTPLPDRPEYGISNLFPTFNALYASGDLAIVQQVAYPDGNGSHFESQEIYEFGVRNLSSGVGTSATWYERLRKTYFDEPFGVLDTRTVGDPRDYGYPDTTYRRAAQEAFGRLARLKQNRTPTQQAVLDTYDRIDRNGALLRERTAAFESTGSSRRDFYRAAQLASAGLGTQIIKLRYSGFDTHGSQDTANQTLFPNLDADFAQFIADAQALGVWDRTCVVFYSEFGRRNAENGSPGTDHGHGGHMLIAGPHVNGGLFGQNVTSSDLNERNLPYYVDFRAPFSACIRDWLGFDPRPIFQIDGETYDESLGKSLFV